MPYVAVGGAGFDGAFGGECEWAFGCGEGVGLCDECGGYVAGAVCACGVGYGDGAE